MTLHEFADLLIRWIHLIAGIMWIGNSMLFNWLDRNLVKRAGAPAGPTGSEGEIWMVHSGGFYQVEKKQLAPHEMPAMLHWFKYQNLFTWLSGIGLLIVVYYFNHGAFLIDPQVANLTPTTAIALSIALLVVGWAVYDVLWRTLGDRPRLATALSLIGLAGIIVGITHVYSGRAAYIHVGVLLGTVMTGNVWMVIIPSQRALIAATKAGQPQDRALALKAKQRSIHNNYMTFPLLFIMLSTHFPSTWSNHLNWLVLMVLMVAGAGVRHFMNIRFTYKAWLPPALGFVVAGTAAVFYLTWRPAAYDARGAIVSTTQPVSFAQARQIIERRCVSCHSANPTESLFPVAPNGVMFDRGDQIRALAWRIKDRVVVQRTMPFINRTGMTDEERAMLGGWVDQGAKGD